MFSFLCSPVRADEAEQLKFFEAKIRPVLIRHCYECHSNASAELKGALALDSREGIRTGGESGPSVVPGNVDESLLIEALRYESFEMPPKKKLPDSVIRDFVRWIELGAIDPRDEPPAPDVAAKLTWQAQYEHRRQWWSLQPVNQPEVPTVENENWSQHPIDRFILAKLEKNDLSPAPRANRQQLARRLSFALLGLPPTAEVATQFIENDSAQSYENLVDQMLASPHFGERWARHWMDVVRYSDTYGYEWDIPAKGAWRYRDYLIRAFNADVPFDQLIREQIAGDLLEQPRIDPIEQINESLIGVMFFQMGENRHGDSAEFNGIHQEMLDNKIDAFSKAFQATTVTCARCHDHKLDAITQREYYALGGAFMSSRWVVNTLDTPEQHASLIEQLQEIKAELRPALARTWSAQLVDFASTMLTVQQTPKSEDSSTEPPAIQNWRTMMTFEEGKAPTLEDPRYIWLELIKEPTENVPARWQKIVQEYRDQQLTRTEKNARDFTVIADFRESIPDGWSVDGVGLRQRTECGDFTVALTGEAAVGQLLPAGLFTHAISPRLNGAIRTPYLNQFDKQHLSFEHIGGDFAAHRTVVDNAFLTERQRYLNQAGLGWEQLSMQQSMRDRHIYIEWATKTSNPNFPPRVGLGGECTDEQIADPRSWMGVTRVVAHDVAESPADELSRFNPLLQSAPPTDLQAVANHYQAWLQGALNHWERNEASADDVQLINWMLKHQLIANRHDVSDEPQIADLVARYRQLEQQLATPRTVCGMADVDPGYNYRLNIRGDYDQLGEAVPRSYLQMLTGSAKAFESEGSGRRELAELVVSPTNPLTARVFVNRVWHWLFGAGLVTTPSEFGHLSQAPTHPQLLDYLASRFVAEGWSTKQLIRSILLSETWKQSGQITERGRTVDPKNQLLHHFPLRRLEAEAIRDSMLAVSGRLDGRLFGPPINPHRQNEDPQKRLFSGPLDGEGRRSIYTKITIMEPPRLLAMFNQPEPKIPTGRRDLTNTPAQSLTLMNDPHVHQQAEQWGKTLVADNAQTTSARIEKMFQTALGRRPTEAEQKRWGEAVEKLAVLHQASNGAVLKNDAVWADVAHAIFNMKEFIYIR